MWGAYLFAGISGAYVLFVLWLMRPWGPQAALAAQERAAAAEYAKQHAKYQAIVHNPQYHADEAQVLTDKEFLKQLGEM